MFAPMVAHQIDGMIEGERRFVHPGSGKGIECIRDRSDAAFYRDRFTLQLSWISAAVPPFMMCEGDGGGHVQDLRVGAGEDAVTDFGMLRDHVKFVLGKFPRLEQHMIRCPDLSD